ncbi:hypothetical protein [Roseibium alexandrii]|uniref:Uncharacterized protein n=1 Tax=Roseibium alexandrii (strain DSM 17067 / NCIMB 14079 / DFL-11) TaxID=244592 RepID=A0A5E8GYQ2_ROSAD|nr:hypothetical protein [Roseibium alexandrii]EEE44703.1 hypothetical protein SADFL11_1991 [Roseibium alexandrii DFL-11]
MGQDLAGRDGRDVKARLRALIDQMDEAAVAAFLAELQGEQQGELQAGRQADLPGEQKAELQAELPADPDRSGPENPGLGAPDLEVTDLGAPELGVSGPDLADAGRLRPAGTKDG